MYAELAATGTREQRRGRSTGQPLHAVRAALSYWTEGLALVAPAMAGLPAPQTTFLHGRHVSGGSATGRARLVRTAVDGDAFCAGEVLVAGEGSEAVLSCLPLAAAVVLDTGGELCAAARLARELCIPAVFGVRQAPAEMRTGVWLTVDGDQGTISVVEGW